MFDCSGLFSCSVGVLAPGPAGAVAGYAATSEVSGCFSSNVSRTLSTSEINALLESKDQQDVAVLGGISGCWQKGQISHEPLNNGCFLVAKVMDLYLSAFNVQ